MFSSLINDKTKKYNRSTIFYKFFFIILLSITIPVLIISLVFSKYSVKHIIRQVNNNNMNVLAEKQKMIEQKIEEIDNVIYQVVSDENMWYLIMSQNAKNSQLLKSRKVCQLFSTISYTDKAIDSIYFYKSKDDFVLSDAKYSKSEFFDKDILQLDIFNNSAIMPPRVVRNNKVISYVRKFSPLLNKNDVYVVINLDYNQFFNDIFAESDDYNLNILIFDNKFSNIFFTEESLGNINKKTLLKIYDAESFSQTIKINNIENFVCTKKLDNLGWTLAYIQNYSKLVESAALLKNMLKFSVIIVLIISFLLAYIFSIYLYRPLAKLMSNIKTITKTNFKNEKNEYKLIDYIVKNLSYQNNFMFPVFRQHSINDLVTNKIFDYNKFLKSLKLLDIEFNYSKYYIALIDFENILFTNKERDFINIFLNKYKIKYILSKVTDSRIMIIINTDNEQIECLFSIFKDLKDCLNNKDIELTISLSERFENLKDIPQYYQNVLCQLENKFFIGKNEIIFNQVYSKINKNIFYDKSLEEDLINSIKSQNDEQAVQLLKLITDNLMRNYKNTEYFKYVYFQICTNIVYSLADIGIEITDENLKDKTIFEHIESANTLNDIQEFVVSLIKQSANNVKKFKDTKHTSIVNKVIDFINQNYNKNLSLDEIAEKVFLSSGYLSNIFKSETGITVFDYITNLRMRTAEDLLANTNNKVSDIAKKVGYNNIQSFLRFFKRYFGMTPVEYRRKSLKK